MRTLWWVMALVGCGVEGEDPLEMAVEDEQAPPVFFSVLDIGGAALPNLTLTGNANVREGAARTRGQPVPGLDCLVDFTVRDVGVPVAPPPGVAWAFTVRFTPQTDLRLAFTGTPSVCSANALPLGPGVAFEVDLAYDPATGELLRDDGAGWQAPTPQRMRYDPRGDWFEATHLLARWP